VIGGGPAGLAAAIAARRHGFRVILADPAHPPIDSSAEGTDAGCAGALAALDVPFPRRWGCRFEGIRH
jgi:flavin-dependent dehydrogenase